MSRAWMPLYVADYLADTGHLTAAEHGAYLMLIMHYWMHGGLPREEAQLRRIARMSAREWAAARETLAGFFGPDWRHDRIETEIAKSDSKARSRSESGARGARAKSLKTQSVGVANATILPEQKARQTEDFALASSPHTQRDVFSLGSNTSLDDDTDARAGGGRTGDLEARRWRMIEAGGAALCRQSIEMQPMSEALRWDDAGCDFEMDVLPAIAASAARRRAGTVRSWGYFSGAVFEARDRRLAPVPPPRPPPEPADRRGEPPRRETVATRMLRELEGMHADTGCDDAVVRPADCRVDGRSEAGRPGGDLCRAVR